MRKFCPIVIGTLHNQTDSTLHLFNILDILTVNNVYWSTQCAKVLHLWHKGLLKWIHSKIVFNMQAVLMDITPDILPTNLCKRWEFNNSGKQTIAKKMKADLDETIENLDEELGSHNWKSHQPEKGNKNLLRMHFRQLSMKVIILK